MTATFVICLFSTIAFLVFLTLMVVLFDDCHIRKV